MATIAVLNTGLIFAGLQDWYQQIARGLMLLLALGADQYGAQRRERAITVEPQPDRREALLEKARTEQTPATPLHAAREAGAQLVYRCRELAKSYGTVTAAYNVGFAINAGEVVCLVGDNGAGKSHTLSLSA